MFRNPAGVGITTGGCPGCVRHPVGYRVTQKWILPMTVRTAWAACPKGTSVMLMRDRMDVVDRRGRSGLAGAAV